METATAATHQDNTSTIRDSDVYCLNPSYRLRNEHNAVKLFQMGGESELNLHHTVGIVLVLCDGTRTVGEIARLVVPLTSAAQSEDGLKRAGNAVRNIVGFMSKSKRERDGKEPSPTSDWPSEAPLIPLSLLPRFGRSPRPKYDVNLFLPKHAYPPGKQDGILRNRAPLRLNWHLTGACATNCVYCHLKRRHFQQRDLLPFDRILELIDECKKIGVVQIDPSGGDILLYPQLLPFLDAIRDDNFLPVRISTKAPVSKELACQLAKRDNVHELQFSLDSTVPEVADYVTQAPGFCQWTLQSIQNALDAGLPVIVKSVITPYNILTIPRLYRELRCLGVKEIIKLTMYSRSGYHHTDDLFNHPETYEWLEKQVSRLREEYPDDFITIGNGYPQPEPPAKKDPSEESLRSFVSQRSRCAAGRNSMMICADGKVIPCEQMPEIDELFVGDVRTQSIQEVWDGQKLHDMTLYPEDKLRDTPCHGCKLYHECIVHMGLCIRDLYQYYGKLYATPRECPRTNLPYVRIT
jgi:radical SAM protein with 4Fe4S-binding SPASM domain